MIPNPEKCWTEIPEEYIHSIEDIFLMDDKIKKDLTYGEFLQVSGLRSNFRYNTYDGSLRYEVDITDKNGHTHELRLNLFPRTYKYACIEDYRLTLTYHFNGVFDGIHLSVNSFAEHLMLSLWDNGINSKLIECDKGLTIDIPKETIQTYFVKILKIIVGEIKPVEWFYDKDVEGWKYAPTSRFLENYLPILQEEALKDRWEGIKPENFHIERGRDFANLQLDYIEKDGYQMTISIGFGDGYFFSLMGKYARSHLAIRYDFKNIAQELNSESKYAKYLDTENRRLVEFACDYMSIPFQHNALFVRGCDCIEINIKREFALQKFCLFLDLIIPIKNGYQAESLYISDSISSAIEEFESSLQTSLEIAPDQEPDYPFIHGFYIVSEDLEEGAECPF